MEDINVKQNANQIVEHSAPERIKAGLYRRLLLAALLPLLLLAGLRPAQAEHGAEGQPDQRRQDAAALALQWLIREQQNEDGGYGVDFASGERASNVGATLDAILALAAAGHNPAEPYPGMARTPLDYLSDQATAVAAFAAQGGGPAGKVLLALTSARQEPRDFQGHNLALALTEQLQADGNYNVDGPYNQALALLGLAAVNEPAEETAVAWLTGQQAADGSWDDGYGTAQNVDTTALAMMALVAHQVAPTDAGLTRGREFLANAQRDDGGWEYGPGYGSNPNSTALAIQALIALHEDVYSPEGAWSRQGHSPLLRLLDWQNPDSGAFQADFGQGPFDDFFATVQALPAVAGLPFPLPSEFGVITVAPPAESLPTEVATTTPPNLWYAVGAILLLLALAGAAFWAWQKRSSSHG
jgi:iron complex transport system substrate-binding protein